MIQRLPRGPGWDRVEADHRMLVHEMEAALDPATRASAADAALGQHYDDLFAEAARFAEPLGRVLERERDVPIRISPARELSFARYGDLIALPRDPTGGAGPLPAASTTRFDCAAAVRSNLQRPALAEARAREHIARGGDVFGAFTGRWRGRWYNREAGAAASTGGTTYDHDWQPTAPHGDLCIQSVLMGEHAGLAAAPPSIGIDSHAPTAALNAVHPATGRIAGAVGVDARSGRSGRPHVGYFVDARTLVWVAHERDDSASARVAERYSCFFEHRSHEGSYIILGVQFRWERLAGSAAGRLSFERWMGGEYQRPLLTS